MKNINYKQNTKILLLVILLLMSLFYNASAADQTKYHEFFVASFTEQINSSVNLPFSFYIGDNLTDVVSPFKSAYFSLSGVYEGGGSIQLKIDSITETAKTFTLPSVSRPTDFNIVYRDETGVLNHASAGTYGHTLNVLPTGLTISGLGAKLETTYKFVPASCRDGLPANEKMKSSEFFVASFNNTADGTSGYLSLLPFSIYIGDNITGVTDPIKSVYFSISGVYTGGGNLDLTASSDGSGTSTRFFLPNVSSPTNFEFIYPDTNKYISPFTAGSYDYNLKIDFSGLIISNFSAKAIITHRYKPATCAGYPIDGELISAIYDSTKNEFGPAYNSIMWKGQLGGSEFDQGNVLFQVAASNNPSGPWSYVGGTTCGSSDWYDADAGTAIELACISDFNNNRYFRYKIKICSSTNCDIAGQNTPQVNDVIVNWSP